MKTILTSLVIGLSLVCCKPTVPKFPVQYRYDNQGDSVQISSIDSAYRWCSDKMENKHQYLFGIDSTNIPIRKIRKLFYMNNNKLYDKKGNMIKGIIHFVIDSLNYRLANNSFVADSTHADNNDNYGSYITSSYLKYVEIGTAYQYLYVDKNGDIAEYAYGSVAFGNYQDKKTKYKFKKGSGHWIDYYPIYHDNTESMSFAIKEEGEIKRNVKYGEWKYYNKNGSIDSTKTYSLKDSVDVRFPHCIFNKKEPFY